MNYAIKLAKNPHMVVDFFNIVASTFETSINKALVQ